LGSITFKRLLVVKAVHGNARLRNAIPNAVAKEPPRRQDENVSG
jgi:hypothetical protein